MGLPPYKIIKTIPVLITFAIDANFVASLNAACYSTKKSDNESLLDAVVDLSRWKWDYMNAGFTMTFNPYLSLDRLDAATRDRFLRYFADALEGVCKAWHPACEQARTQRDKGWFRSCTIPHTTVTG